jgi:hypothetical protein
MRGGGHRRGSGRLRLPALLAFLLAALGLAGAWAYWPGEEASEAASDGGTALELDAPDPVEPAFVPGPPRELGSRRGVSRYAPVRAATAARERPDLYAPVVARLGARTPEGTQNIVLVLDRRTGADARLWIRVALPALPSGATGWVLRRALAGYGAVRTHLVVDLGAFRATLLRGGRPVFSAAIGVGRPEWPTPTGRFYVRNRLTRYASPFYGPVAFGTSARSSVLTDWPAGGFVGIHGTNRPELLPGRVSHGCIRLRNEDIRELARLMPIGTPITIR